MVAEKVSFIQTRAKEHQSHLEEEVSVAYSYVKEIVYQTR